MSLTLQQLAYVEIIDNRIAMLLQHGNHEERILIEMLPHMSTFKTFVHDAPTAVLNLCYANYEGFYYYALLLERLEQNIASGRVALPAAWDA